MTITPTISIVISNMFHHGPFLFLALAVLKHIVFFDLHISLTNVVDCDGFLTLAVRLAYGYYVLVFQALCASLYSTELI